MARYKDSTVDLILKGHFDNLKRDVNKDLLPDRSILEDVKRYLSKQKDPEAQTLLNRISGYEKQPLLDKRPMQRAGKSANNVGENKKAG